MLVTLTDLSTRLAGLSASAELLILTGQLLTVEHWTQTIKLITCSWRLCYLRHWWC